MSNLSSEQLITHQSRLEKSFIDQRLEGCERGVYALKSQYPEVLSMCLFGSYARGTATSASDIDGFLFFDLEILAKQLQMPDLVDEYLRPRWNERKGMIADSGNRIRENLIEHLKSSIQLQDDQLKDIWSIALCSRAIDQKIEQLRERKESEDVTEKGSVVYLDEGVPIELYGIFYRDIGGGIGKYRSYLIEKLIGMGEEGKSLWSQIIRKTERWEGKGIGESKSNFPQDLSEAKRTYILGEPDRI